MARNVVFYLQTCLLHNKFSQTKWVLDHNSIFAQVDAFVQRCKDLIDVCDGQMHFARWQDGEKIPLPYFHGARGPEITRNLLEIETTFDNNLWILRNVKKTILDVKATSWHDDYNKLVFCFDRMLIFWESVAVCLSPFLPVSLSVCLSVNTYICVLQLLVQANYCAASKAICLCLSVCLSVNTHNHLSSL